MKIKQYRNLFENWQRHLVEDEVSVDLNKNPEKEAEKAVAASIPVGVGVPEEQIDSMEKKIANEFKQVVDYQKNELPKTMQAILDKQAPTASDSDQLGEEKTKIYNAIVGVLQEGNRGGMEAQNLLRDHIQQKVGVDAVVLSNVSGSNISDVVVIKSSAAPEGTTGLDAELNNKLLANKDADVLARFEIKSSGLRTDESGQPSQVKATFFDQTVGTGQTGKTGEDKYFAEAMRQMAIGNEIVFKTDEGSFEKAEEHLSNKSGGKVFSSIMDLGYTSADGKPCGRYGEMIAPDSQSFTGPDGQGYYDLQIPGKEVYSALRPVFSSNGEIEYFEDKGYKDAAGLGGVKGKQIFFVEMVLDRSGEWEVPFYFKMTAEKQGNTYRLSKNIAKTRAAADSGKMETKCFKMTYHSKKTSKEGSVENLALGGIRKHWKVDEDKKVPRNQVNADDYFVIVGKPQKHKGVAGIYEYTHLFIFTTGDKDPLRLGVPKFSAEDMWSIGFDTYGLADIGQIRLKVESDIDVARHMDTAGVVEIEGALDKNNTLSEKYEKCYVGECSKKTDSKKRSKCIQQCIKRIYKQEK
jgi:hypothetical protein